MSGTYFAFRSPESLEHSKAKIRQLSSQGENQFLEAP